MIYAIPRGTGERSQGFPVKFGVALRLPDEIQIDTIRGMDIKIVDPDVYGNNYLEFETIIPHHVCSENEEFVFKRDDSIF